MYLCAEYWDSYNFDMPNPHCIEEYSSCNFVCTMNHEGDEKKRVFCKQRAWHSFDKNRKAHEFECDKEHKTMDGGSAESLDICFLIDATGSMSRWVDECKKTISMIIEKTRLKYPKLPLRFAVVGYRDHPMSLSKMVHELRRLAILKLEELQKIGNSHAVGAVKLPESKYIQILMSIENEW